MSPSTQPPTSGPSTPSDPIPSTGPVPSTGSVPSTPAGSSQGQVEQAKADLAARLGVRVDEVTLVSADEVTWPDASLGCPQPGMMYAQMLTNGSRIVLAAGGKQYHYHSAVQQKPFLCTNPQPPLRTGG